MKKIVLNFLLLFLLFLIALIIILSTVGIETNKFNKFISNKAYQTKKINLALNTIQFKLDLKKISLFLETENPKIIFKNVSLPIQNIKIYIDFLPILKSDLKIRKINLILEELDIAKLNKLSAIIKPSNFKNILKNKVKKGKLISEIEIFLNEEGVLENFISRGSVTGSEIQLLSNINLSEIKFSFFADKNDILFKNIFGNIDDIKIVDGDLKLNLEDGIKINSNFDANINLDHKPLNKYQKFFTKYKFTKNIKSLKANLNNNIFIDLDKTYKLRDYNYKILGKLKESKLEFHPPFKNSFLKNNIKEVYLSNIQLKTFFSLKNSVISGEGKYSFNNDDFLNIQLENKLGNETHNLKLSFDFLNDVDLDLINYRKAKNSKAKLDLDLEKKGNFYNINEANYKEANNSIKITKLKLKNNRLLSFDKIRVITSNNDFLIQNNKKILINGTKFDATNLLKLFNKQDHGSQLQNLNSEIEIDFKNIKIPMSEKLENFKLIGEIKKGKFVKISSKGDFGGNNFLDISMKKEKNNNKKYLEIYSDLTRPLLAEYNFFKGLSGGKLLFTSIIDESNSSSKLKIENFKVINAPGLIKLLSLSDLGGLADIAEGDGLSFDLLEINMEKNKNFLKLNEILAIGPSVSVLMDGYLDENGLTSLRGTLVPAKTLNKMISKIPVLGNIVIPKEVGEGLFGISFKMKGPKDKIKTTINPIKTLTPRFIQKIIESNKKTK